MSLPLPMKRLLAAFSVALALVVLAACGGEPAPTSPSGQIAATAPLTATPNVAREVARGKRLAQEKGCLGCHTTDGRDQVGPTWKGLFGTTEELTTGGTVEVNEEYLEESIVSPNAGVVRGFLPNIMPMLDLTEAETNAIIAYIKSLR